MSLNEFVLYLAMFTGIGGIVLLVVSIILWVRIRKLRQRLALFMNRSGIPDLEQVIAGLKYKSEQSEEVVRNQNRRIDALERKAAEMKANVGLLRYNAFSDQRNELSFAIAIINDMKDGVVLSSIHTRNESYMYAKPLKNGTSSYALTPEENVAVTQACERQQ